MAVALHASSPARIAGTANPTTTATFSPPASSVIYAICQADSSNTFVVSGGGLTWTPVVSRNVGGGNDAATAVFMASNPNAQTNITVSSTKTGSFTAHSLRVLVFTGAETTFGGATASGTTQTLSVTTTRANSWVWSSYADESGAVTPVAATGCTLQDAGVAAGGITCGCTVKRTAIAGAAGSVEVVGVTSGSIATHVAFEVREPAAGGGGGGSTLPVVRSVSSKGKVNVGDLTVAPTKPAGLALNDYILVLQASDADVTLASMTAPAGFVTLASQTGGTTNNYGGMKIWGKVADATDVAASTFTFNYGSTGDGAVIMMAITAGTYDTTTPITLAGSFTVQARIASAVQTVASMTGVVNGLLMGLLSTDVNGTVQSYPSAGMTGFTLVSSQVGIAAAPFCLAGVYSKALVAAGATGASTVTPTGASTNNGWVSTALVVNPPPDDGTGFFYELAA
jgi:hypothetical protein